MGRHPTPVVHAVPISCHKFNILLAAGRSSSTVMSRDFLKRKTPGKAAHQPNHRWGIKEETACQNSTDKRSLAAGVKRLFQGTTTPNVARAPADAISKGHDSAGDGPLSDDIIGSEDDEASVQQSSFKTPAGPRLPVPALAEGGALRGHEPLSPGTSTVNTQGLQAQRTFISSAFSHQAVGSADQWTLNPSALSGGTLRAQLQKCLQEDNIALANTVQALGKRRPLYQLMCTARKVTIPHFIFLGLGPHTINHAPHKSIGRRASRTTSMLHCY
jgi:hypothetical protein